MNEESATEVATTEETTTDELVGWTYIAGSGGWVKLPSGTFLNLARVSVIAVSPGGNVAVMIEAGWVQSYGGSDAQALINYLDSQAFDLTERPDADN